MSLTVKGGDAMRKRLERIAGKFPDKVAGALRVEAELIMSASKARFVPVDLGTLRSSGYVNPPERSGDTLEVTMGYGGAAAAYATALHEHPSGSSPPSWQGTTVKFSPDGRGPKYLERPLMEAIPGMDRRIAKRLGLDTIEEPVDAPRSFDFDSRVGRNRDRQTGRFVRGGA